MTDVLLVWNGRVAPRVGVRDSWPMEDPAPIVMHPVGFVHSSLLELADAPSQAFEGAPEALLEIDPAFADALHGITSGDELIVVTWLDRADRSIRQTHPRGDTSVPLTGVFKTRSPDRPNPLGIHRVRVLAIEDSTALRVDALEAVDGTPIVDLKIAVRGVAEA